MITLYGLLWAAGGNDILATQFHLNLNQITYFMRGAIFVLPVIVFIVAKRWCISLQRQDNDKLLHGYETGVIMRSPEGGYSERHLPLEEDRAYTLTARDRDEVYESPDGRDANGVPAPTRGWTGSALGCRRRGSPPTCRSRPARSSRRATTTPRRSSSTSTPPASTTPRTATSSTAATRSSATT